MGNKIFLRLRALRTFQGDGIELFAFFMPGSQILRIAGISRIHRDDDSQLHGFQRKEIRTHVKQIGKYLRSANVLFPNAIILCMSSDATFKQSRGRNPRGITTGTDSGFLDIPLYDSGDPVAWIVDGQQRSLALSEAPDIKLQVPVIAFVSGDLSVQREQFILVNKAKPLSVRLINELLPEVSHISMPRDLTPRRIPSELCNLLNQDPASPFFGLIRQMSTPENNQAVVNDSSIIKMIKNSIKNPLGALAFYKSSATGGPDIDKMYSILLMYWTCIKETFPDAWGKPPTQSRLLHSTGIEALGILMDRLVTRTTGFQDQQMHIKQALQRLSPYCSWTEGLWETMGLKWNDIQNTGRHIKMLADTLIQLDFKLQNSL